MEESIPDVFESAAVARLHPGDVVLFRCPWGLTSEARAHLVEMLNEVFPDQESIILEGGADIAVLRPEPGILVRAWRRLFHKEATQ